ncbi:MAG: hypothetical protein IV100_26155 [Myxococcales bacterium]|nr:hypothetical protein [Myxococcales bacterium]
MSSAAHPHSIRLPQWLRVDLEAIAAYGTACLERIVAIDSQSDERSATVPSTPAQRVIAEDLERYFRESGPAGLRTAIDASGALTVQIPASPGCEALPAVAFMTHIDTARGTHAVPSLQCIPAWDGGPVRYPENPQLVVDVAHYPRLAEFVGDDVLHGPGQRPFGLDDKLGTAEVMTLAWLLATHPTLRHGPLVLVFRPDEEIGRHESVVAVADRLAELEVRHAFTVDGLWPFEINVSNFNASHGRVRIPRTASEPSDSGWLAIRVDGAKSHGATAKAEGYLNATTILARALATLPPGVRDAVSLARFETDAMAETSADVVLRAPDGAAAILAALRAETSPHAWRGAAIAAEAASQSWAHEPALDRAFELLVRHRDTAPFSPVLSEESDGHEGYSNLYAIRTQAADVEVDFRLRDFSPTQLQRREEHVRDCADQFDLEAELREQYIDMGPALEGAPQLVRWPQEAAVELGLNASVQPIRGGTGVDPFLERGIPVGNLGTGYFAPESEKELTSRQMIARHALWLCRIVQKVA